MFGGIVTIIFRIGIVIYLVTELIKVIEKKSNITSSQFTRNLAIDTREMDIDENDFDIGFTLLSFDEKIKNHKELPLGTCKDGRFKGETVQTQSLGIQQSYTCPQNFNAAFSDVNEKHGNPVKTILKNFYATSASPAGSDVPIIAFYIQLDDIITTTYLELYTISDALSSTGGLIGIVTIILQVALSQIQSDLYQQSLVKDLFQIRGRIFLGMPRRNSRKNLRQFKFLETNSWLSQLKLYLTEIFYQKESSAIDKRIFKNLNTSSHTNHTVENQIGHNVVRQNIFKAFKNKANLQISQISNKKEANTSREGVNVNSRNKANQLLSEDTNFYLSVSNLRNNSEDNLSIEDYIEKEINKQE
ncbi:UNKNOWN [Stylonychia lemnae]|uniref:Uncharacterized protein n=1 Tax=Stylonychia lemnae TaxID=5949 RepID=A0A078AX83_STYLE|nr:UNKNOWN [Stylonychia lemnae]|eukprot:CDW86681.1 UNKNOWN [Stylonychia lemnae]